MWKNISALGFASLFPVGANWSPDWRDQMLPKSDAPSGVKGLSIGWTVAVRNISFGGFPGDVFPPHQILGETSLFGPNRDEVSNTSQ